MVFGSMGFEAGLDLNLRIRGLKKDNDINVFCASMQAGAVLAWGRVTE
jgi:hypothetical protein